MTPHPLRDPPTPCGLIEPHPRYMGGVSAASRNFVKSFNAPPPKRFLLEGVVSFERFICHIRLFVIQGNMTTAIWHDLARGAVHA